MFAAKNCLLTRPTALVPVTFGAAGTGQVGSGSHSIPITVVGNALVVILNTSDASAMTITIGGNAVSRVGSAVNCGTFSGFTNYIHLHTLMNPPTGSQTVSISGTNGGSCGSQAMSFQNVGSFGSLDTQTGTGNGSHPVSANANGAVAHGFGGRNANWSSYNKTLDFNANYVAFSNWSTHIGHTVGEASPTFTATHSGAYGGVAIPLDPA